MKTLQQNFINICSIFCVVLVILSCSSKKEEPKIKYDTPIEKKIEKTPEKSPEKSPEMIPEKIVKNAFYTTLETTLKSRNQTLSQICDENDSVSSRILREYGAIFVAAYGVLPPNNCVFTSSAEVEAFQSTIQISSEEVNKSKIELQSTAMQNYLAARDEAQRENLDIRPRGGAESARRGFDDTVRLWKSRVDPACEHWLAKGRLTADQIGKLKSLGIKEQVKEVLELEKSEIFFSLNFSKSILSSVAAPGTSQHLSLLALDVEEFADKRVREIMGNHGWFRTVQNDAPHFTFLGRKESELDGLGLKKIETKDGEYWIPNL